MIGTELDFHCFTIIASTSLAYEHLLEYIFKHIENNTEPSFNSYIVS